ncbi:MAG: adenylate/guanylate cyclase domain-containing protein [Acidimicrobiia bacterium]|nr:adenylate/guanylate cyclase domain-containing protein [Acidimicrobiia bacterium]
MLRSPSASSPRPTRRSSGLNLAVFLGYLLVTVLLAVPVNKLVLDRAVEWVQEGRPPTPRERRGHAATAVPPDDLRPPRCWLAAGPASVGLLNEQEDRTAAGVVLAGIVACALLSLLRERLRPVSSSWRSRTALPRTGREDPAEGSVLRLAPRQARVPLVGLRARSRWRPTRTELALGRRMTVLVATGDPGGWLSSSAPPPARWPSPSSGSAARSAEWRAATSRCGCPSTRWGRSAASARASTPWSSACTEREQLHDLLDKQVGAEVAREALAHEPRLGGERRVVTVLFVDLTGYTAFSEDNPPERVMRALNGFFQVVVDVVTEEGGFVNKFEGDAALCVFGAPVDQPDHPIRALRAAARLPVELARLTDTPRAGIGVATGEAIAGFDGYRPRRDVPR